MLLPSPSIERQPRASVLLLPGVLLCVVFATVCASHPANSGCPRHVDCALERRHHCKPGSSQCGPCLPSLEENEEGRCVARKRLHYRVKLPTYPELDEEIDQLRSVIAKQEVSEEIKPQKLSKQTVVKSHTDAPEEKPRNQGRPPTKALPTNTTTTTTTPAPATAPPGGATTLPRTTGGHGRAGPIALPFPDKDRLLVIMISLCILVSTLALIVAAVCWVRLQKKQRLAQKVDYPAFGGIGKPQVPVNGTTNGDNTLAQSAQMYHYQHQKQQMISIGKGQAEQKVPESEMTSDEEETGGDFTVYECPGLAPTGEMEVKNPLFDDSTLHYHGNHK